MIDRRTGKERCAYLKQLRLRVAEEYGIDYKPAECNHEGDCAGTCPQCEKELCELTSIIYMEQVSEDCRKHMLYFNNETKEFVIR